MSETVFGMLKGDDLVVVLMTGHDHERDRSDGNASDYRDEIE